MIRRILSLLAVSMKLSTSFCADPFESFLIRPVCYRTPQPGCNTTLVDAYPEVAYSATGSTKATTWFLLYTTVNPDVPELMHECAGGLPPDTKFNPQYKTEIIIPGFCSGVCLFAIFRELKNERLKSGCYNVILVDWTWGNCVGLVEARNNMEIVAEQTAIVIRFLKAKYNQLTDDDFIVTGHSLGAHIAGFVGQKERIGSIIGLDPAGVLFSESTPLDKRLDAGDAKCVTVLHCNGGQCLPRYFGLNFTCGTADFWINGGLYQPSCYLQTLKAFLKGDFIYAFLSLYPPACYHFQCLQYYRASMNTSDCQFIGVKCSSNAAFQSGFCRNCGANGEECLPFGVRTCNCFFNDGQPKNYYLNTKLNCPYCDNSGINTRTFNCAPSPCT